MATDPLNDVDRAAAKAQIAEETKDLRKRLDASGRLVAEKTANKPFFVHQDYQKRKEAEKAEKAERQRLRAEAIARGENPGPDPDAPSRVPVGNIFRLLLLTMLMGLYAGHFIVGDPLWGYESRWLTVRHWASFIPDGTQKAYTEAQLARYDGSDPEKPVLLAYDDIVYDVSEGRRTYGPSGTYHQFAGRDAARAYVTGCFKEHLTHDVRGFNEQETKAYNKWKKFYAEHPKYRKVGTVYHTPIHPDTPIPPMCERKRKQQDAPAPQPAVGPEKKKEL